MKPEKLKYFPDTDHEELTANNSNKIQEIISKKSFNHEIHKKHWKNKNIYFRVIRVFCD